MNKLDALRSLLLRVTSFILLVPVFFISSVVVFVLMLELISNSYNLLKNGYMYSDIARSLDQVDLRMSSDWVGINRLFNSFIDLAWNAWGRAIVSVPLLIAWGYFFVETDSEDE